MPDADALWNAISAGDLEAARTAVARSPDLLDACDDAGVTPIMKALYHGKQDIADSLAAEKPALSLFESAAMGRFDQLRERIAADAANIDAVSPDGFPLLSLAAFFGQFEIADWLVDRGADVNAVSTNGAKLRPIHAAAARNAEPTMRKLLSAGADPDAQQHGGWTALHSAAKHGNVALLDLLLEHNADTSIQSDDGKTAADLAADAGHTDVANRLRSTGA